MFFYPLDDLQLCEAAQPLRTPEDEGGVLVLPKILRESSKSLQGPLIEADGSVTIEYEKDSVSFVKSAADNATNGTLGNRSQSLKTTGNLLVAANMNHDKAGSISTLEVTVDCSQATSMLSSCGATSSTIINGSNREGNNSNANSLERPRNGQRGSSGSIDAAVAKWRQNMTRRSAAQRREANLAIVLVSSVTMFLICHAPRIFQNL